MNNTKIIIGAGLSGLMIAYPYKKKGIDVLILEANTRIGGRIETVTGTTGATMEMVPPGLVNRISILLPC
jgi:monoamine oxidase